MELCGACWLAFAILQEQGRGRDVGKVVPEGRRREAHESKLEEETPEFLTHDQFQCESETSGCVGRTGEKIEGLFI